MIHLTTVPNVFQTTQAIITTEMSSINVHINKHVVGHCFDSAFSIASLPVLSGKLYIYEQESC